MSLIEGNNCEFLWKTNLKYIFYAAGRIKLYFGI